MADEPSKIIEKVSPYYKARAELKDKKVVTSTASQEYKLSYNSSMESLEPVYFWILDFPPMAGAEKIVDNFISSPGSGHFSELMGKATRMQEEAMKVMQTIGILIKSVQNIIWDLKQFEIRLKDYDALESKKKEESEAALLALKQIWMDNVDIKRGNTSIKALAFSQASFATLIDAFMVSKSLKQVNDMDLNERVKNILKQKYLEFDEWLKLSGIELRKRYNMEKSWLKSQADALKLYSRWASPYLKAAEDLRMNSDMSSSAALVKAFNTILLQLTLLKKDPVDVTSEMLAKNLPPGFDKLAEKKKIRPFYACIMVDFTFRGIPQRVEQHYGFGGKSDVTFRAFALNQDELDLFKAKLGESETKTALQLIENMTGDSLKQIQEDIDYFTKTTEEKEEEEKKKEKKKEEDQNINPFTALLGPLFQNFPKMGGKKEEKDEKEKKKEEEERIAKLKEKIPADNYAEKLVRKVAELNARKNCFTVYDIYKKAHGMPSVPFDSQFQKEDVPVSFKDVVLP